PLEAYGSDPDRWNEIIQRVKKFNGDMARAKLERFQMEDVSLEEFSHRQLNDTRYIARLAGKYLARLYGGMWDRDRKRRIQVVSGGVTALLRNVWNLNSILGDGGEKRRDDHRHHAVDAIVIALIDPYMIKNLSDAAKRAPYERRRLFGRVDPPWPAFLSDVRDSIMNINVSHRVSRRVRGPLHKDTIYSKEMKDENGKACRHVRKSLEKLSKSEVKNIVDREVKKRVIEKLEELKEDDPGKAFANEKNHPFLETKNGEKIPIHRVRIRKYDTTFKIGKGPKERHVVTGKNHHIEIFKYKDEKGNEKWDGYVVSLYEAKNRLRSGKPVINRNFGEGKKFVFSLAPGEYFIMRDETGDFSLYRVTSVSEFHTGTKQIEFRLHTDARPSPPREGRTKTPDKLGQAEAKKVTVTPLGEIRWAND
ncbi:MAG: hypothetical protein J7L75_00320, partial [Thermoproteales archaeon]|nr:hypothetical protein [Thermoproteales archaeon]